MSVLGRNSVVWWLPQVGSVCGMDELEAASSGQEARSAWPSWVLGREATCAAGAASSGETWARRCAQGEASSGETWARQVGWGARALAGCASERVGEQADGSARGRGACVG